MLYIIIILVLLLFCFTICYEALLELHVYFILTNYDVIQTVMISMHDVRFTHS